MTTLRPWSSTSWRTSWRSSSSLGAESPWITLSSGAQLRIAGQTSSNWSWARPLEMIRWVVSRLISRRNSAWVSGRFGAICMS